MTEQKQEELKQPADAPKADDEELKTEDPKAPEDKNVIDYKAELEKATTDRDNYKEGMLIAKQKLKDKKDGVEDEPEEEDIDDKIAKAFDKRFDGLKNDINSGQMDTILDSMSSNEDEKKLIAFHYKNSIQKSGISAAQVREDLENAKLVANKSKLISENEELRTSLIAKNAMTFGGGSNLDKPDDVQEVKLSQADMTIFNRFNKRRTIRGDKALTEQEFLALNNN